MKQEDYENRVQALREEFSEAFNDCFDCAVLDYAPGWFPIIEHAIRTAHSSLGDQLRVDQMKEKFGLLRIYSNADTDVFLKAEDESNGTCMFCGDAAQRGETDRGWILTLCPKCIELTDQGARFETHFEALTTPANKH